ncbi:hypothetical protein [Allorhizocola rhizosphaerae]|uniref:hypothetical protein n=1 Tax=Allorhizocola rhizosphaerae TaxID=1872709 RepID=UPI000E3C2780|nr:hypothetical protein [Allorhizocola rhizosphaerae]
MSGLVRVVVGAIASILGLVWLLQGINVLPGSFMTGDPKWAVIGMVVLAGGLALLISGIGRVRNPKP